MPWVMTIKPKQLYLFLIWPILFTASTKAQQDFESWHCFELDYSLFKKTNLWLSNEVRFNDNSTYLKKYLVDVGVDQKLKKGFSATFSYRYTRFDDNLVYKNEHQLNGIFQYSHRIQRFIFGIQTRYQYSNVILGYTTYEKTEKYWRNKASISYKIPSTSVTPYISFEHFTEINAIEGLIANKYRSFAGIKYKLNKYNSLALYYGIQNSLKKVEKSYILGLKYSLSLDWLGDEKDEKEENPDRQGD
jgi:hypothetical protein